MSRVRPILFNTEMVRAILDGRKTVTRRVIKPQPLNEPILDDNEIERGISIVCNIDGEYNPQNIFPPCQPEYTMYVRETWARVSDWCDVDPGTGLPDGYIYKADWLNNVEHPKWHPSIHMPKEAARIWLKVTNVRVERLQNITISGLQSEGFWGDSYISQYAALSENIFGRFKVLWDSTIKKSDINRYGWEANPFVWRIEFERCEKPESEA